MIERRYILSGLALGSAMIAAGIIAPGLFQRGPGRQELRINLVVSTFPGAASLHEMR